MYSNNENVSGNNGDTDFWIVKLKSNGDIEWQKCLGGTLDEYAISIKQASDWGYIVTGETRSNDGNVSGNHGYYDYWVVKLNVNGNIMWQKCLGGSDGDFPAEVMQTSDGGFIVVGASSSNNGDASGNNGYYDFWVVKLDTSGNIAWQKCFGGSQYDSAQSVNQLSDGGYIVVGFTYSENGDVTFNNGEYDYWILRLDKIGNLLWERCLGGSYSEYAYSADLTFDGGCIIAGYTISNDGDVSGNHGGLDFWVVKTGAFE